MFKKFVSKLPPNLADMLKKWVIPAAGAAAITAVIIALLWQNNNRYVMLFGAQENLPVSQVVEVLAAEGMPYRVEPKSGGLLVREGDLPKARMMLAAKGITAPAPAGYELMDKDEMLGSSQFIQNVRFRRSLEGELAQSMMALESVDYARVHLGIVEGSSFVLSNKPDSSASVMLRLKYGRQLSDDQVAAIVSLVAGSVPGMKPEGVRVVDQRGTLLSANIADLVGGGSSLRNSAEMIQRVRQETEQNLANLLTPLVGRDNFRISVVPHIDFSQVEETQERHLNEPRTLQENINQQNTSEPLAAGIPGSLSNRPATAPVADAAPPQPSTSNQVQRQFSWDRDVRHIRHAGFQLQKLSVSVVLNQQAAAITAWSDAQQAELQPLLANAAGIDTARGDRLTLSQLAFITPAVPDELIEAWWERDSTLRWAERGGIALLVLLIVLFGLLPMMRRIGQSRTPPAEPVVPAAAATAYDDDSAPGLPTSAFPGDDNLPPQGSGLETKVAFLQTLAQSETDRVAEVLKQWISSNDRVNSDK